MRGIAEITKLFAQEYKLELSLVELLEKYQIDEQGYVTLPDSEETVFALRSQVAAMMQDEQLSPDCVKTFVKEQVDAIPKLREELRQVTERLDKVHLQERPKLRAGNKVADKAEVGKLEASGVSIGGINADAQGYDAMHKLLQETLKGRDIELVNEVGKEAKAQELKATGFSGQFGGPGFFDSSRQQQKQQTTPLPTPQPSGGDESPKLSPR